MSELFQLGWHPREYLALRGPNVLDCWKEWTSFCGAGRLLFLHQEWQYLLKLCACVWKWAWWLSLWRMRKLARRRMICGRHLIPPLSKRYRALSARILVGYLAMQAIGCISLYFTCTRQKPFHSQSGKTKIKVSQKDRSQKKSKTTSCRTDPNSHSSHNTLASKRTWLSSKNLSKHPLIIFFGTGYLLTKEYCTVSRSAESSGSSSTNNKHLLCSSKRHSFLCRACRIFRRRDFIPS